MDSVLVLIVIIVNRDSTGIPARVLRVMTNVKHARDRETWTAQHVIRIIDNIYLHVSRHVLQEHIHRNMANFAFPVLTLVPLVLSTAARLVNLNITSKMESVCLNAILGIMPMMQLENA